MIFENLDFLHTIPLADYSKHFGKERKESVAHRRRRSNMMLNPLNLKHLNRIDESEADMITLNLRRCHCTGQKKGGTIQYRTLSLPSQGITELYYCACQSTG